MRRLIQFILLAASTNAMAQTVPTSGLAPLPQAYYAVNYGVKADTQSVNDATVANASSTVTCPNSDCHFTAADVGKIVFGTTDPNNGSVIVPQGTITTVNSATSITVSSTSTGAATATLVLVWGHDDTTALNTAWTASAGACQMLNLPIGKMLFQSAIFITDPNPACTFTSSASPFPGVGFQGISINGTWLIATPNFSFASCTGTSLVRGAHVCIGGGASSRYNQFTLWGAGNNLSGVNLGGAIFLDLSQGTGINQADILGWGAASTNSTCVLNESAQSGFYQGGLVNCGYNGMEMTNGAYCGSAIASTFLGSANKDILIDSGGCFGSFNGTYQHVEVLSGGLFNSVQDNFYSGAAPILVDSGATAQFTVPTGPGYTGMTCNGTCSTPNNVIGTWTANSGSTGNVMTATSSNTSSTGFSMLNTSGPYEWQFFVEGSTNLIPNGFGAYNYQDNAIHFTVGPNAATAPTGSCTSASKGWILTMDGKITFCNGTAWANFSGGGSGISNITITLPTTTIPLNSCTAPATATMTGVTTSSVFDTAFATNPNAVTGWGSTGGLVVTTWPTANTLNWSVCNQTGTSITPGAMTLNVGAR